MFRVIVGVLAAFVGFSFGHALPQWIENRTAAGKPPSTTASDTLPSAAPPPSAPSSPSAIRRKLLRLKSHKKFKMSVFSKPGREFQPAEDDVRALSSSSSSDPPQIEAASNQASVAADPKCLGQTKRKSQMQDWKRKLLSLKNKAAENERAWYKKFDRGKGQDTVEEEQEQELEQLEKGRAPCFQLLGKQKSRKNHKGFVSTGKENAGVLMRDTKPKAFTHQRKSPVPLLDKHNYLER